MTPLILAPLEMVYASLVKYRDARFQRTPPARLQWPVVSIGNLSVGGAGKTPLVICLARVLSRAGFAPDVLSRGYGRTSQTLERVTLPGEAGRFGDEPVLIAEATGVPVYVGTSRYEAGLLAERELRAIGRNVHMLDDGFQHRQLARNLDIVVVHRSDLQQRLLPAGRLREPLAALHRADVIVLRDEDADVEPAVRAHAKQQTRFWRMRRVLTVNRPVQQAVAFCAIARPDEFFSALAASGAGVARRMRFRDHHRYTPADVDRIAALGEKLKCDAFVLTAKDAVKLDDAMRERLRRVAPIEVADLSVSLEDENQVVAEFAALFPPAH